LYPLTLLFLYWDLNKLEQVSLVFIRV